MIIAPFVKSRHQRTDSLVNVWPSCNWDFQEVPLILPALQLECLAMLREAFGGKTAEYFVILHIEET